MMTVWVNLLVPTTTDVCWFLRGKAFFPRTMFCFDSVTYYAMSPPLCSQETCGGDQLKECPECGLVTTRNQGQLLLCTECGLGGMHDYRYKQVLKPRQTRECHDVYKSGLRVSCY